MAQHPPRFEALVEDAKKRVREVALDEVQARLDRGDRGLLVAVREESEWAKGHMPAAMRLAKRVTHRDIEKAAPLLQAPPLLYCGRGFRSALAADNLQKMGYTNV